MKTTLITTGNTLYTTNGLTCRTFGTQTEQTQQELLSSLMLIVSTPQSSTSASLDFTKSSNSFLIGSLIF